MATFGMRLARVAVIFHTTAACGSDAAPPFRPLGPVARVAVTLNYGRDSLPAITDPARVRAVAAFVDARESGWHVPWAGVRVPRVRATFYRSPTGARGVVHNFGAGPGFFEATRHPGDFASRPATDAEIAEFLHLIGAPPDAATHAADSAH